MNSEPYKVSICVPVYGVEKYIERCARSLFEQTYEDVEYVFVDDCTQDRSVELLQNVIENYPSRKDKVRIIHQVVIVHLKKRNQIIQEEVIDKLQL